MEDNSDSNPERDSFQEDDEERMDPEVNLESEDPPEEDDDDPDFDPEMDLDFYPKKTKAHCSICNLDFKTGLFLLAKCFSFVELISDANVTVPF